MTFCDGRPDDKDPPEPLKRIDKLTINPTVGLAAPLQWDLPPLFVEITSNAPGLPMVLRLLLTVPGQPERDLLPNAHPVDSERRRTRIYPVTGEGIIGEGTAVARLTVNGVEFAACSLTIAYAGSSSSS